jgi:hypothetical protein
MERRGGYERILSQGGENRSVNISGSNVNSPIMSGEFESSVDISYSGNPTTITSTSNNIAINKEYLDKMHPDYSESSRTY